VLDGDSTRASGRSRLLSVVIALLAVAGIATPVIATGSSRDSDPPFAQSSNDPDAQAALRHAQDRDQRERSRLATPAARHTRALSRTAFRHASHGEALAIARSHYQDFVQEPLWRAPNLLAGERIKSYAGEFAALVDRPSGPDFVLESTVPLTTPDEEPVNTTLVSHGADLVPANDPVPTTIARDARDGVRLDASGVGLSVPGTGADSAAVVSGDKAFFPNVGSEPDTDLLVAPAPGGVEAAFQLRSADSPVDPTLALDLPAGAELRVDGQAPPFGKGEAGAAEVVRGGRTLATVAPPVAVDADGQAVPASYEARGSNLVVHVDHRHADVRYPILVDPYVIDNFAGSDFRDANNPGTKWTYSETITPFGGSQGGTAPVTGTGLNLEMYQGSYYPATQWAQWIWAPPADSRIVRVDFVHVAHDFNSSNVQLGIVGCCYVWQGDSTPADGRSNTPYTITGAQTDTYRTICTDAVNPCASGGASDGNVAVFRFLSTGGGNPRARSNYAAVGQAQMSLWENHAPSVTGLTVAPPTTWVDTGTHTFRANATDMGLGLKSMSFQRPSISSPPTVTTAESNLTCNGDRRSACPLSASFPANGTSYSYSYADLPEGDNKLGLRAIDFIGNPSSGQWPNGTWDDYSWHVKADHSAPTISGLSGPLYDDRNQTDELGNVNTSALASDETVTVAANDGSTAAPRSGVASVEMRVDGVLQHPADRVDLSCTASGCPYSAGNPTFTFHPADYANGTHTVTILVRDKLADPNWATTGAHTTISQFDVNVDNDDPDPGTFDSPDGGSPSTTADLTPAQDAQARSIVASAAADPTSDLNHVVGIWGYSLTEVGQLQTGPDPSDGPGTVVGAVTTLSLAAAHDVDTAVPAYSVPWPDTTAPIPFRAQFVGPGVADLSVQVDFATNSVIDIHPGVDSTATSFDPLPGSPALPPQDPENPDN
jgi:hypothetical protein